MTVDEVIKEADRIEYNTIDEETKKQWVYALENKIRTLLFETVFPEYDYLFITFPYDKLYSTYVVMRIGLENGNIELYNKNAVTFNQLWCSFCKKYGFDL